MDGLIIGWFILSILVAVYANNKGQSGILTFIVSMMLSPLIAFIIVFVSKDKTKIKCYNCGQNIDKYAKVCPFCNKQNENKIIKINQYENRLVLNKKDTPYSFEEIKKIIISTYDESKSPEIELNTTNKFYIKGQYRRSNIIVEVKKDTFEINSYDVDIPSELEVKDSTKITVSNTDKLIELGKLYKEGLLSKEEFEEHKKKL